MLTGSGVAGSIAAPLINQSIAWAGGDWRGGWYCVFAAACVSLVLSLLFVKERPESIGQRPDGDSAEEHARAAQSAAKTAPRTWKLNDAVRTRAYWFISLAAVGETVPSSAALAHGVAHLRDLGHTPEVAASAISMFALASVGGKLSAGYLCDRFEPGRIWTLFILMLSAAVVVATLAESLPMMVSFSVLLGLGAGGALTCWHATVARHFGPGAFATILGSQMPFSNAFAALAPFLTGLAFDRLGSYELAFYLMAMLGAVLALLVFVMPSPESRPQIVDLAKAA